jgi:hypothetical protein
MNPRLELFWVFTGAAALILLTSIPMVLGLVPRNRWYGWRTRRSMNGTEAEWYAINRKGGIVLFCTSAASLLILVGFALFYKH